MIQFILFPSSEGRQAGAYPQLHELKLHGHALDITTVASRFLS